VSGAPFARATSGSGRLRVALGCAAASQLVVGPASEPQTSEAADLDLARGARQPPGAGRRMRTRPCASTTPATDPLAPGYRLCKYTRGQP
jgi:hypothetical protein